jgi:hypothetical protein
VHVRARVESRGERPEVALREAGDLAGVLPGQDDVGGAQAPVREPRPVGGVELGGKLLGDRDGAPGVEPAG